ncbi:hypothetical protein ScPMuIL_013304 [Solemya velum]
MAGVGHMEEEAWKRKERLKSLKRKQNHTDDNGADKDAPGDITEEPKESLPKPVFRSYKPQDESLKEAVLPKIKPADVTEKIQSHLEASKTEHVLDEVDLVNLAPRKPDWDLKRDVSKKLAKLERRTQRAIVELIRERLKTGGEDLALMVNASQADRPSDDDDD